MLIRARYLVDAISYDRVRGLPFKAAELEEVIKSVIEFGHIGTAAEQEVTV
jgi:2-oxoglutarate ferredoxin oxidoreductase subunit alpha